MKKLLTLSALLMMCAAAGYAQEPETSEPKLSEMEPVAQKAAPEIAEPDFIGEVLVLHADGTATQLEKATVQLTTKANAGVYIVGIGKARTRINVPGPAAKTRLSSSETIQFIVKAVDNDSDPLSIIDVFRFDTKKNERQAELASVSTFGGGKSNNLEFLPFTAKKYGDSSYLITLLEKPAGEYGIIVRNPNALDERSTIVSSFAIEQ